MPLRHKLSLLLTGLLLLGAAWGCNDSHNSLLPGNQRPRVVVNITPADPLPGDLITVDASDSSDDGGIVRFDLTVRTGSGQTVTASSGKNNKLQFVLVEGTYSVTVLAVDAGGETTSRTFNFVVSDCGVSPFTTTTILPDAIEGQDYTGILTILGGVDPVTVEAATGFKFPSGLSVSADGIISGIPAQGTTGSYLLRLVIRDSCAVASRMQDVTIPINIAANPAGCPALSIASGPPPDGNVGAFYSFSLSPSGGQAPISWDIATGALPPGIVLLNDTLTGSPSAASIYVMGIRATDSCLPTPQSSVESYTIRVNP